MNLKMLLLAVVAFAVACGAEPGTNSEYNSSGFDVAKDAVGLDDTVGARNTVFAAQLILASDPKSPVDEQLVQEVLDSLRSSQRSTRGLQAKAISRIWPRCDGGLAEVVGLSAFNYVEQDPVEFFSLFPADIPWQELGFWSDMIAQELIIEYESDPLGAAKVFFDGLNERAKGQGVDIHVEVDRTRHQVLARISDITVSTKSQ